MKRPNVEALLLGLTKQGFEVVFWCENSVGTMDEPLNRLLMVCGAWCPLGWWVMVVQAVDVVWCMVRAGVSLPFRVACAWLFEVLWHSR